MQLYEKFPAQFLNFIDKQCDKQYSPWEKNSFLAIISTFLRLRDVKCQNDHSDVSTLLLAIILEGIGIENK